MPAAQGRGSLLGKWALVYVGDGACDEDCRQALVFARQTRLSLNKDMTRVNSCLLATANCCDLAYLDKEHEGIKVYDVSDDRGAHGAAGSCCRRAICATRCSSSIRCGNIVMRYDVRENPRGLLDDLKKLLKLSHIG